MSTQMRFTTKDLESFPDPLDDSRYEIIDGELYMSKQPHYNHQEVCSQIVIFLGQWANNTKSGKVSTAPGLIFADDDNVAPDLVWISFERRAIALEADGKFHAAPELVVEVLSPGVTNETRDKEAKLKLYSRRGVLEYWIASWEKRQIEIYRRNPETAALESVSTLYEGDVLKSPHLKGFSCEVKNIFEDIV
jgi:Uma2 family endonuclease